MNNDEIRRLSPNVEFFCGYMHVTGPEPVCLLMFSFSFLSPEMMNHWPTVLMILSAVCFLSYCEFGAM